MAKSISNGLGVAFLLVAILSAAVAQAAESEYFIPDEYESNSAVSPSMNNAGYASNDPHSAIRANPALLGTQKAYSVTAGYHWPTEGRDYYQASVVDTKTAAVAAGVSYTGFMDEYKYSERNEANVSKFDSPIEKRGVVALSHVAGNGSIGIGATYVKATPVYSSEERREGKESVQGTGLNLGFAYPVTPQLMFGAATENMSNSKIKDYAPRTQKAGISYVMGTVSGNFDLRQRERVNQFEAKPLTLGSSEESGLEPEKMAILSVAGSLQQYLKVTASYGQSLTDNRKQVGGGLSLTSQNFVLSYTANRPYLTKSAAHQAVALTLDVSL